MEKEQLVKELESLINRFSVENRSNTPDFILAEYLVSCLFAYEHAKNESIRLYPSLQSEVTPEFPQGKEAYCPRCYFEDEETTLRSDCPHNKKPLPKETN